MDKIIKTTAFLFVFSLLAYFSFPYFFPPIFRGYANFLYKEVLPPRFNWMDFEGIKNKLEESRELKDINSKFENEKLDSNFYESSAILILGGNIGSRIFQAISLYFYKVSNLILITSPKSYIYNDFGKSIQSELTQMEAALNYLKLPYEVIPSYKDGAQSTYDEALDAAVFLRSNPRIKNIIIVTDEFHSRRAYAIFNRVFKNANMQTNLFIVPAQNKLFNKENWYKNEAGIAAYFLEIPKFLLFILNKSKLSLVKEY